MGGNNSRCDTVFSVRFRGKGGRGEREGRRRAMEGKREGRRGEMERGEGEREGRRGEKVWKD